jgi:phage shock protein B
MDDMVPIIAIISHSTDLLITVFAIVTVVILAFPLRRWIAMKERSNEQASSDALEKIAQHAAETERLKQRVAVLERILTDRSANLADEIERLRDTPLN